MPRSPSYQIGPCSPFLIVADLEQSVRHYEHGLGFETVFSAPEGEPFFAIMRLGSAQIMLKELGPETPPQPNAQRHKHAPWDVFVFVSDPDALAADVTARGVAPRSPLHVREDGLRGFEIVDPDGYVIFFGLPASAPSA